MTPLYIIPARGGSKGIPKKNIKNLCGKPLISYTIETALQISDRRHIIMTTDSEEIAAKARECGLPTPYMRPAHLATDTAGSREVILDAMDWADAQGIQYDCVVLLQPTSPMRKLSDVKKCLASYTPDVDMVVSVTESATNPYYDCFEADSETGYLQICKGDGKYTRRQDAPHCYQYNGAVYVINPESIRKSPLCAFSKRIAVEMPKERSIDLDTPTDWVVAEALMNHVNV